MSDCIEFQGCKNSGGYGKMHVPGSGKKGKQVLAHRWEWEQVNGPIPEGMNVCHSCDNPPCINLEHLFLGTGAENQEDKLRKGRQAKGSRIAAAKLTEETVVYAMARMLTGRETQGEIAEAFGVTRPAINLLWNGKSWSHVFAQ